MRQKKLFQSVFVWIVIAIVAGEFFVLLREEKALILERVHFYALGTLTIESIDHQEVKERASHF